MIFLGLGSNMGNKAANIQIALKMLSEAGIEVKRVSSFYQTEPWGHVDQDDFVNAVVEVEFEGNPRELLRRVLKIEEEMGRVRIEKWGPRLIDIDILEFHRETIEEPGLSVPHPYYPQRMFVVAPLHELEPNWVPTGGMVSLTTLLMNHQGPALHKIPEL